QIGEILEEHDILRRTVRIDETELRRRRGCQHVSGQGHHRCDAGAGGDTHDVRVVEVREVRGEPTLRAHHLYAVAGPQVLVRPGREHSAQIALDADRDGAGRRR